MTDEEFDKVFVIVVTIILLLEMLIGLSANILVLIISSDYIKTHWERGNSFNVSLHIVDAFICVTIIPLTIFYLMTSRHQHPLFCLVFEGTVSFISIASSLTLFFICLDRYYAVMSPTVNSVITTRTNVFIAIVWIGACFAFCSPFFGIKLDYLTTNWTTSTCGDVLWTLEPYYHHEVFYIVAFLMTAVAMLMFYIAMKRVAKKRIAVKDALVQATVGLKFTSPRKKDNERKTVKLSLAIVCSFLVFWGPHLIITILTMFVRDSLILDIFQIMCLVFAFLTTVIHPLLYAVLRQKFRATARKRFKCDSRIVGCATNGVATIEMGSTSKKSTVITVS